MKGAKLDPSCHTWTLCHDRYQSLSCAERKPKQGRFLSKVPTYSPLCDSQMCHSGQNCPLNEAVVMTQGWAVLICLLTELASAISLYNSVMHFYFKIFCHSGLAKTSLSQIWLLLQLWEPQGCISVLPATFTALLTLPLQGKAQDGLRRKVSCEDWSETTKFIAEV